MSARVDPLVRPLAFSQGQQVFAGDPVGFAAALAALLPIGQLQVAAADHASFCGRLSHCRTGDVEAVALSHTAASWRSGLGRQATVLMLLQGELEVTLATRRHRLADGGQVLYLPPGEWCCHSPGMNALVLTFNPTLLAGMLGRCGGTLPLMRAPRHFAGVDPVQATLLASLSRMVSLFDLAGILPAEQLALLELDLQLHRLVALLLAGAVLADGGEAPAQLAPLLRWIEAHLDRPLSLRDLEQASGYSGRTLQYAFKRRFGCSPMRWVRQRRLERAREVLLRSSTQPTVARLAEQVGYVNQSAFTRDFRQNFGVTPSSLIGRGRS